MPKFTCRNPECLFVDKEFTEGVVKYVVIGNEVKARERFCPHCNSEREDTTEKNDHSVPAYEAVGMNSNRRNWSDNRGGGIKWY